MTARISGLTVLLAAIALASLAAQGWRGAPSVAGVARPSGAADLTIPDPSLTPGAVVSTDRATACAFQHTPRLYQTARSAYFEQARQVFQQYGIDYAQHQNFELDHLVPRCLGGADAIANLWPEPLTEAVVKDIAEARICRAVCTDHTMTLEAGQRFFTTRQWRHGQ
jgi:hypothetical protein